MKMSEKRLNANLDQINALKDKMAELKAQQTVLIDEIKTYMEDEDIEYLKTDKWQVFYEEQIKYLFNEKEFIKKYGEDTYLSFKTKESTSRPFKPMALKQP